MEFLPAMNSKMVCYFQGSGSLDDHFVYPMSEDLLKILQNYITLDNVVFPGSEYTDGGLSLIVTSQQLMPEYCPPSMLSM